MINKKTALNSGGAGKMAQKKQATKCCCNPFHGQPPFRVKIKKVCERDRKPSSVEDDHLSRPGVAARVQAMTGTRRATAYVPYASCTRWGLQHGQVAKPWVSSYLAFPSLPGNPGGFFLLHSPWSRLHRPLAGTLPCGARTFLTPCGARSSGHLARMS